MEVENEKEGKEDDYLKRLYYNDQLVFRYCDENGDYANGKLVFEFMVEYLRKNLSVGKTEKA